jgi:hypothetical protein
MKNIEIRVRSISNEPELYRDHARSETPIKVGDALGVAIYAYTHSQQRNNPKDKRR